MTGWTVPPSFAALRDHDPNRADFVAGLPRQVESLLADWRLRIDGPTRHGLCAVVIPVTTADGRPAALKVHVPDEDSEQEHLALRLWNGRSAVELLRADPARQALLLERLSDRHLISLPVGEACDVVGALYAELHRPATERVRPLSAPLGQWTDELARLPRDAAVPHRLVEQAVSLGKDFLADPATTGTLIHTDLHDENVLAPLPGSSRPSWIAIDPKPLSGDPHYEPAPMLWNRWDVAEAAHDLRAHLRSRFFRIVDASGLDEERAKAWVVVRMMHNALWAVQDADAGGSLDRRWITTCVAVAKAVQD